jgi:hypothetical protein
VGASEEAPLIPPDAQIDTKAVFSQAVQLEGVQLDRDGDLLHVRVWWHVLFQLEADHTILVHVYNADGDMLASGDTPPLRGAFPTSLWEDGDVIVDEYEVVVPAGGVTLGLGLYNSESGARLMTAETAQQGVVTFAIPGN